MTQLTIGDLTFELQHSDRRQTVGITVDRDGSLIIRAPADCPLDEIERIAREKRFWIYTKLAEKEQLQQAQPARSKEYVSGEGFYYLGRSYRLLLIDAEPGIPPLRLYQGRFRLRRDEQASGRQHFVAWYTEHAKRWIGQRVERYTNRADVTPEVVQVRDLGYRWASCSPNGAVNFHWRAILLPSHVIDYLIVHELVHLREPNHSDAFWQRVARVIPDYAEHKHWLAQNGAAFDL